MTWTATVGLPGEPVMLALWGVSVLALAAVLDRTWAWLRRRARSRNPGELLALVHSGAIQADVNRRGLERGRWGAYGRIYLDWETSDGHRGQIEQAVADEADRLNRNVWILECAAGVGPLLGILGTLMGIGRSFNGFDGIADLDPTVVSRGISLALETTVAGLSIAIAAVVLAHAFRRLAERAEARMEAFGEGLLAVHER